MDSKLKTFSCTFKECLAVFSKKCKLEIHIRTHTGERPFACDQPGCDKQYTSNSHLKRHTKSCHSDKGFKQAFVCSECNLSISTQANLRRHYARIHDPTRKYPFACKECNAGFHRKQHLARHMFFHTGDPPYKCDKCDAGFLILSRMKKHQSRHKKYLCEECSAIFSRWSELLSHRKNMHTKKYRCNVCKKSFQSKQRLKVHSPIHGETRDVFPCPENNCPRFYFHHRNLMTHIRSIHKCIKYPCPYPGCEMKLVNKSKRDAHLRRHYAEKKLNRSKISKSKRKDFNKPKRSAAVKLSGLTDVVSYDVEKKLIRGDILDLSNVAVDIINHKIDDENCETQQQNEVPRKVPKLIDTTEIVPKIAVITFRKF